MGKISYWLAGSIHFSDNSLATRLMHLIVLEGFSWGDLLGGRGTCVRVFSLAGTCTIAFGLCWMEGKIQVFPAPILVALDVGGRRLDCVNGRDDVGGRGWWIRGKRKTRSSVFDVAFEEPPVGWFSMLLFMLQDCGGSSLGYQLTKWLQNWVKLYKTTCLNVNR